MVGRGAVHADVTDVVSGVGEVNSMRSRFPDESSHDRQRDAGHVCMDATFHGPMVRGLRRLVHWRLVHACRCVGCLTFGRSAVCSPVASELPVEDRHGNGLGRRWRGTGPD